MTKDRVQRRSETTSKAQQMISDDEEGPQPMRGQKPASKHPTAADQFKSDHQGPDETIEKERRDRVKTVHNHNSGYPKLRDELEKRRSLAKIHAKDRQRDANIHKATCLKCKACIKIRKRNRFLTETRKSRNPRISAKVTKYKYRYIMNRGCQYSVHSYFENKMCGTTDNVEGSENMETNMAAEKSLDVKRVSNSDELRTSKDDVNPENSRTLHASATHLPPDSDVTVSSYNTFGSIEQEPMV